MQTRDFMIGVAGLGIDFQSEIVLSANLTSPHDHTIISWLDGVADS